MKSKRGGKGRKGGKEWKKMRKRKGKVPIKEAILTNEILDTTTCADTDLEETDFSIYPITTSPTNQLTSYIPYFEPVVSLSFPFPFPLAVGCEPTHPFVSFSISISISLAS